MALINRQNSIAQIYIMLMQYICAKEVCGIHFIVKEIPVCKNFENPCSRDCD